jgi:hypothetical protein
MAAKAGNSSSLQKNITQSTFNLVAFHILDPPGGSALTGEPPFAYCWPIYVSVFDQVALGLSNGRWQGP